MAGTIPCPTEEDIARFGEYLQHRNYARETIQTASAAARRFKEYYPAGLPIDRDVAAVALANCPKFSGRPHKARHVAVWAVYRYLEYYGASVREAA